MKKQFLFFTLLIGLNFSYGQKFRIIKTQLIHNISCSKTTNKFKITCLVPNDIDKCQKVLSLKFSHIPNRVFTKGDNKYAEFIITNPLMNNQIIISTKLKLTKNDFLSNKKNKALNLINRNEYLKSERNIESDNSIIKSIAAELKEQNEIKTIKNIFKYVAKKFKYKANKKDYGALGSLDKEYADCSEHSDLFVSLCRANGIPARSISGCIVEHKTYPWHAWAEVFLLEYGWVKFEPTKNNYIRFKSMENKYLQLSNIKNDLNLSFHYWGGKAERKSSFQFLE